MTKPEKTVGKKGELPDSETNEAIRLNEDLGRLETSIRQYVDERFQNLPDALLAAPGAGKTSEDSTMRAAGRWSWRFDVYLLLALALLGFLVWRTYPWQPPPVDEKPAEAKEAKRESTAPPEGKVGETEEQKAVAPAEEGNKKPGGEATAEEAGTDDRSKAKETPEAGDADTKPDARAGQAEEGKGKSPQGEQANEDESNTDPGTTTATPAAAPAEERRENVEGQEEEAWWSPLWKRLLGLAGALKQRRVDLYFLIVAGLLSAVLWKLHALGVRANLGEAAPQSLGLVWYLSKGWRYRPWTKLVRQDPERVAAWLGKLSRAEGLPPDQLEIRWEAEAVRWRDTVEKGRDLGDADMEACVRLLFQYFYALLVLAGKGPPDSGLPMITGQPGAVNQEGLKCLARELLLGDRLDGLDPDGPRAQVAVVVQWLKIRPG